MEKEKSKIKDYFKELLKSIYDTGSLFKFAIYSWLTPLIILIITIAILVTPTLVAYNTLDVASIESQIPQIDNVLADTLSRDFKCSISDKKLACDEKYLPFDSTFTGENGVNYTYKVFVNSDVSGLTFAPGTFENPAANENYLIFFESSFRYRYVYRDPTSKSVIEYQLSSFYDNLDGVDFSKISQTYHSYEDEQAGKEYLLTQSHNILLEGVKALAYETMFISFVSDIGTYLLFLLIVALLIKGNYLLKRKKGFSYSQSLKIAIVSSIQSILASLILVLFAGVEFITALGLTITARVLYIYIRYTGSRKNTKWIEDLYAYTKDERFNP